MTFFLLGNQCFWKVFMFSLEVPKRQVKCYLSIGNSNNNYTGIKNSKLSLGNSKIWQPPTGHQQALLANLTRCSAKQQFCKITGFSSCWRPSHSQFTTIKYI